MIQETWLRSSTPRRKSAMMLGRMVTTTTWSSAAMKTPKQAARMGT